MSAQGPGEKLSLFHVGTKSSGGPSRGSSGCLCWFVAAGAPQELPGAQAEWGDLHTPCKEAQDSQFGPGAGEAAASSALCAEAAKVQGSGGAWQCWIPPVTLALDTQHWREGQADVLYPSKTLNPVYSKGRAELQAGTELRGCPVSAGRGRSSRQDLPGSVGSSTKRLCGSRRRSWQNCCTSSGQFWGWIITTSPALNLGVQGELPSTATGKSHRHSTATPTRGQKFPVSPDTAPTGKGSWPTGRTPPWMGTHSRDHDHKSAASGISEERQKRRAGSRTPDPTG